MMNKKGYLLIGLIYSLFITNIMSQELKTPTLEDLIPGGETYRYAETCTACNGGETCVSNRVPTPSTQFNPKQGKRQC